MAQISELSISEVINTKEILLPSKEKECQYPTEKSLLTKVLQKYENDPWLKIETVEISKACNAGDNYMSTIQRALVSGVRSNGQYFQQYFIMKRQMEDLEKKKLFMAAEVWANEEHMYFTILPRLRRHCTQDLPHPRLYYCDENTMVMEDLKEKGYTMAERLTGLDLEQSLLVMQNLALFHASSLAMQRLDPEVFNIMKANLKHPYNESQNNNNASIFIQQGIKDAIKLIQNTKHAQQEAMIIHLKKLENDQNKHLSFLKEVPKSDFAVLIHGDLWVNNILISYDRATNKPILVKFVDFQATRIGSIAKDILHLIYTSIQPDVRKNNYDTLIKTYYDNLISYLRKFIGSENECYIESITMDKVQNELKTYRIYGLINAIIYLPVVTCDGQTNNNKITNGDAQTVKFHERLTDVIDDYMNKGWI